MPVTASEISSIPAEDRLSLVSSESERARDDHGGVRARERSPQLAGADRPQPRHQPLGLLRRRGVESLVYRAGPERADERRPVALMLGLIKAQHARANHLGRRESRIVDREAPRVPHHLKCKVISRHQPPVERRDPRHRLPSAQLGEQWVGRAIERFDGDRSPHREVRHTRHVGSLSRLSLRWKAWVASTGRRLTTDLNQVPRERQPIPVRMKRLVPVPQQHPDPLEVVQQRELAGRIIPFA